MKFAPSTGILKDSLIVPAGVLMLAAFLPLIGSPNLLAEGGVPFLVSFVVAGLAYVLVLVRLPLETPRLLSIWGIAILLRVALLFTPVSLSEDVYRYVWDGHLLGQGVSPYAQPADSPLLDAYDSPLRERVIFPWMATPYLPAAQGYFLLVNRIAPHSAFAFQAGAAILDLFAGLMVLLTLRRLHIPEKAVLVYLWNPLVVVEFAHGAHVDALMVFFLAAAVWALAQSNRLSWSLSALALAAAVLVKGWPLLMAPIFARRWGLTRTALFAAAVLTPLALFAAQVGWGLIGPADGRGVFGAVRIYSVEWEFNSGLYFWLALLVTPTVARLLGLAIPALVGLAAGLLLWRNQDAGVDDAAVFNRRIIRLAALPFAAYLLLAHTIHPWYLALMLVLLPFFWPAPGETAAISRWIWPWIYFMFFEAFTYLSYTGIDAPQGLPLIQTAAYLPFWLLIIWSMKPYVRMINNPLRSLRDINDEEVNRAQF
jgi:alpha-1,6-mannosyltransferase